MSRLTEIVKNSRIEAGIAYQKAKRTLGMVVLGAVCVYGVTQAPYLINNLHNDLVPSPARQRIEQKYGIDIKSWRTEVESDENALKQIEKILEKEMQDRNFAVNSIRIRSRNLLRNNSLDHFTFAVAPDGGYYNSATDNIVVEGMNFTTLRHEIKHAKTFEVLKEHPEFKTEWEAFAKDENGNSLYKPAEKAIASRFRGLRQLFKTDARTNLVDLGFVSEYATTNFYEDVAETATEIDSYYDASKFFELEKNPRLLGKVRLLEKHGLIAKGYLRYMELKGKHNEAVSDWGHYGSGISYNPRPAYFFLEESNKFLSSDANPALKDQVLMNNASIIMWAANKWKFNKEVPEGDLQTNPDFWHHAVGIEEAEDIFYRVLELPQSAGYREYALKSLSGLNWMYDRQERGDIFFGAWGLEQANWNKSNSSVIVNDFLKQNGVMK